MAYSWAMTSRPRLVIVPRLLIKARMKALLNQDELAEKAGISKSTIKSIETSTEDADVRISTVRDLAAALDCSPDAISRVLEAEAAS